MKKILAVLTMTVLFALPAQASGHDEGWSAGGGIGFAANTGDAFLIGLEAPYKFRGDGLKGRLSVGPAIQFGFDSNVFLMMFAANSRVAWGLEEIVGSSDGWVKKMDVFGQAGLGVSYLEIDVGPFGSFDDAAFLINFGWGVDYDVTERVTLTSNMLFNIHAGDLFGDSFTFSWQVVGARYNF